jgi:hypothetical protein
LMNSVTIGDRENCGLRRMHLSSKCQHHYCYETDGKLYVKK